MFSFIPSFSLLPRIALGVILFLALIFSLLPLIVKQGAVYALAQLGLEAQIKGVELSLFNGRLQVLGLEARNAEGRGVEFSELELDIALRPLLNQRLLVESFYLDGLDLDLLEVEQQWQVAGVSLAQFSAPPTGPETEKAKELSEKPAGPVVPWSLALNNIEVKDLRLCAETETAVPLCAGFSNLNLAVSGSLSESVSVTIPALSLRDVFVRRAGVESAQDILLFKLLALRQFALEDDILSGAELSLQQFSFMPREGDEKWPYHAQFTELQLLNIEQAENLKLSTFGVDGLRVFAHLSEDGTWQLEGELQALLVGTENQGAESSGKEVLLEDLQAEDDLKVDGGAELADSQSENKSEAMAFSVDASALKDAEVLFQDDTVHSVQHLRAIQLELGALDSRFETKNSPLFLKSTLGEFGLLDVKGEFQPLNSKVNANFDVLVEGFDLVPASAYLQDAMGNSIDQGNLNHKLKVVIKDDMLDIENKIVLDKFEVSQLSKEEKVEEGVDDSLPISVALSLLRDGKNQIHLDLPVKGHISDPSLSLNQIFGVVLRKALTRAVLNYYTPFGVLDVASMLVNGVTKLRFDPIVYELGSSELNSQGLERVATLAKLLLEKNELSLVFCSSYGEADRQTLWPETIPAEGAKALPLSPVQKEQLEALALQRVLVIKQALLVEKVQPKQLVSCAPEWDKKAGPEVEVYL